MNITPIFPVIEQQDITLMDSLQSAWIAFRRAENAAESTADRQTLERLRNRLSDLMNELEGKR